ncbi:hypothetical protein QAD02_000521 [Eretmocerus hayati]|uniref:Uncharacterized protein n=1 Tax=Eretmocerus hayati TaxID=131215 RepID=A0ACC2NDU3_9HYME|nr:hypothetical protein QAD02_000521 [Eretmocerus hayati]
MSSHTHIIGNAADVILSANNRCQGQTRPHRTSSRSFGSGLGLRTEPNGAGFAVAPRPNKSSSDPAHPTCEHTALSLQIVPLDYVHDYNPEDEKEKFYFVTLVNSHGERLMKSAEVILVRGNIDCKCRTCEMRHKGGFTKRKRQRTI